MAVMHELFYVTVDARTGDIYWTEDLARRVLVLRANAPSPSRVAGNGARGIDAGGVIVPGAIALNTALAVPSSITLDADGLPVFLDGYSPGRIVRLAPSGLLKAIAVIGLSPSQAAPIIDGALEHATAYSLSGLAFIRGGSAILVADTALFSVVREIDLAAGTILSVVGSTRGSASLGTQVGTSWSDASFGHITAFAILGDNVVVSDAGNNILRVIIAANTSYVSMRMEVGDP